MNCKICNSNTTEIFEELILKKYNIKYFKCQKCGFIHTEKPYWLDEAYKNSISVCDTGVLARNISNRQLTFVIIHYLFSNKMKCLDYAGGYGIFTRLMRDIGIDYYWLDKYSENLTSRGFEYTSENKPIEFLTAFEVFEHLENPKEEMVTMLEYSDTILLSTLLLPTDVPTKEWWYYLFEQGQHISFYSQKSFEILAAELNLNYYKISNEYHLFTKKKINKSILKIVTGKFLPLFYFWGKRKSGSLTWSDHQKMKIYENIN